VRKKQGRAAIDDNRLLMPTAKQFYLRSMVLIAEHFPNDLTCGIIWIAINSANTSFLLERDSAAGSGQAGTDAVPSSARRPVTRLAWPTPWASPMESVDSTPMFQSRRAGASRSAASG
jgi:hypothetical protein